ncbi:MULTISPECIES: PLP-dependent aminotransferase family protein [Achromobacter]|uniref:PLP-dependent aminotransferase family protein n=1 Tax=Achromobacter spanius TaxID=217203 RepID=A0ABY8GMM5_9BURK|nr:MULTISPECIES: PLP-dependent aminotransferase family protein [Achromobacter]WAI84924.1 PLP-dependent aminotransferase family protein [Achromobacter spanius]WEX95007.1 PLP-dependent aminotransferase family protein [Achromobacter sp. SS2-2022]WFP05824.1 PLP-dependent aminotransferase family protein [Achromobacter spanius]
MTCYFSMLHAAELEEIIGDPVAIWVDTNTAKLDRYKSQIRAFAYEVMTPFVLPYNRGARIMRSRQGGFGVPLYRKVAAQLEDAIGFGVYALGDRLPSLRLCAKQQGVSLSTVLEAYRILEDSGLIETRPQAGHFVVRSARSAVESRVNMPPNLVSGVEMAELIDMVMGRAQDPALISFATGYPTLDPVQTSAIERALLRAVPRSAGAVGRSPCAAGATELRRMVALRALSLGCAFNPQDLIITSGTTESITLCLSALLEPGNTVALESPTSFGFLRILEILNLRCLEIPTHPRYGMSVDALKQAVLQGKVDAVLSAPTLSNPTGACMPLTERKRLEELLRENKIPMVEDAVYNDLVNDESSRRAVKSFDHDGWILLCNSYSKTVSPALRVGWLHPGRFGGEIRRVKSAMSVGNCPINELALAELLAESQYGRHIRRLHRANRGHIGEACKVISASFPVGTCVTDPNGGSALWIELPRGLDAQRLFALCLDEGILIAPGSIFSATRAYRNCVRISISGPLDHVRKSALRRIGELATRLLAGQWDVRAAPERMLDHQ